MYQGHKNWTHWNVSLWMFNDESIYRHVVETVQRSRTKDEAARRLADEWHGERTPDGAAYTYTAIRAAIAGEI